ncbi:hypothetical protein Tco_1426480 [Tanacetum coccineum]
MLCDQIVVLKRDASFNESEINDLKIQIERLKKEKERCQISDNNRKGVGYNAVAPPPTGLFAPPTIDLSNFGLEEFKQPKFEGYGVKGSDCDEDETLEKVLESANVERPKQADQPRKISQNPRNNNYDFHDKKMVQKLVLNNVRKGTGQREVRPVWNNAMRTNNQNFSNSRSNFAPTAVLTKSGLVPISTARQTSSRAATSVSTAMPIKTATPKPFVNVAKSRPNVFQKSHSLFRRPFYQQTALKNKNMNNKVNSVNTAKGKRLTSAIGEQGINAVGDEAVHKELGDRIERAATTASSFKAEQDSDAQTRFEAASKCPMIHLSQKVTHQFTKLCTKLSEKVTSLEKDLKQTKQVYGKALTKLVKKVKHLEDQLKSTTKRRKEKVVISDKEEDLVSKDPSKQGRRLNMKM